MVKELQDYMQMCESYQDGIGKYSLYIRGFWIPHLKQQEEMGNLEKGKEAHKS